MVYISNLTQASRSESPTDCPIVTRVLITSWKLQDSLQIGESRKRITSLFLKSAPETKFHHSNPSFNYNRKLILNALPDLKQKVCNKNL